MKHIGTIDELKTAIDNIDMDELHHEIALRDSGWEAWLYWDGENVSITIESSNTSPAPGNTAFAFLRCDGNNISHQYYAEGWVSMIDDPENEHYGEWVTGDDRYLSDAEMISECITEGDHTDMYDDIKAQIIDDWKVLQ